MHYKNLLYNVYHVVSHLDSKFFYRTNIRKILRNGEEKARLVPVTDPKLKVFRLCLTLCTWIIIIIAKQHRLATAALFCHLELRDKIISSSILETKKFSFFRPPIGLKFGGGAVIIMGTLSIDKHQV